MWIFFKNWLESKKDLLAALMEFCLALGICIAGLFVYYEAFKILQRTSSTLATVFHSACVAGIAWQSAKKYYKKSNALPRKILMVVQEEQAEEKEKTDVERTDGNDPEPGEDETGQPY